MKHNSTPYFTKEKANQNKQKHITPQPKEETIRFLLDYAKAIKPIQTKTMKNILVIMN